MPSRAIGGSRSASTTPTQVSAPELIGTVGDQVARSAFTHTDHLTSGGSWTVVYRGRPATGAVPPLLQGVLIFAAGTGMSLLLAILIVVLATGRTRALRIADEKTDELTYNALHDSLTDLPNRALALDRATQLLARAPGTPYPVAALYIDIDTLGQINDAFGHAVGDKCVSEVADRIRGVLRDSDTAARVDGDEFVVLIDSEGLVGGPELVAERLLEVVREPFQTGGDSRTLPAAKRQRRSGSGHRALGRGTGRQCQIGDARSKI